MRFFYDNEIDKTGVVFTPSSEISTLPASNVANELRTRVWRTGISTATETLVFDLGSAKAITAIILIDHTLTSGDSAIKVEANTANSWGAPAFTQTLTWASGTISQTFASQSYRYWRLSFTKSAAGESRDIGRIFLGTYYEAEHQPDYNGLKEETDDLARTQTSLGGQEYVERVNQRRMLTCEFSEIADTFITSLRTIFRSVGEGISFFVQVDTAAPLNEIFYVKFGKSFRRQVDSFDASYLWAITLDFREQL